MFWYTVSNLNSSAIDFAGLLFFEIPMCHDSATKPRAIILKSLYTISCTAYIKRLRGISSFGDISDNPYNFLDIKLLD